MSKEHQHTRGSALASIGGQALLGKIGRLVWWEKLVTERRAREAPPIAGIPADATLTVFGTAVALLVAAKELPGGNYVGDGNFQQRVFRLR
jgi:hypothetical protein